MDTARNWFNGIFGIISAIAALACLAIAKGSLGEGIQGWEKQHAYAIVGAWAVLPPVFFWVDWVVFCQTMSKDELDRAKHTHDLSRNIWLALVILLGAVLGIKLN
jgi:hypothetical protein